MLIWVNVVSFIPTHTLFHRYLRGLGTCCQCSRQVAGRCFQLVSIFSDGTISTSALPVGTSTSTDDSNGCATQTDQGSDGTDDNVNQSFEDGRGSRVVSGSDGVAALSRASGAWAIIAVKNNTYHSIIDKAGWTLTLGQEWRQQGEQQRGWRQQAWIALWVVWSSTER